LKSLEAIRESRNINDDVICILKTGIGVLWEIKVYRFFAICPPPLKTTQARGLHPWYPRKYIRFHVSTFVKGQTDCRCASESKKELRLANFQTFHQRAQVLRQVLSVRLGRK
jgi:hypothetical protein